MSNDKVATLRAENEALRQQLGALETIFNSMPDLYFRIDVSGIILEYKAGRIDDLYVGPEHFMGKVVYEVLPPHVGTRYRDVHREALASRKSMRMEYSLEMSGGEQWYESHITPLESGDATIFVRNITEQRRDKLALERLNVELEAKMRERTAALHALSTPLVPIAKNVVAVPLIGTIDADRAAQLLETMLQGVQSRGASVVLLDVTGVPSMNADAANSLVRAARAVSLLGAQLVLTGVGPDVARTLVELGADLRGIVTLNSLEQGIVFAMKAHPKSA